MPTLAFVDVETTGTDPSRHHLWEIALVVRRDDRPDQEFCWQVRADLSTADPAALRIGGYYQRRDEIACDSSTAAEKTAMILAGSVLVAANVGFDAAFIDKFLRANGHAPAWDYHLVEIESMAGGALGVQPPWKLNQFLDAYNIQVADADRHTALGDAKAVRDLYDAIRAGKPADAPAA